MVVGRCCLCSFGNGFVYSGTLGIVEQVWETYHLDLSCLLPCPLLLLVLKLLGWIMDFKVHFLFILIFLLI